MSTYTKTTIHHTAGSVVINGKVYENINGTMTITDKGIFVNGQPIEEYKEPVTIKVVIKSNVDRVDSNCGNVTVEGDAHTVCSQNGSIQVNGNVTNNATTENGAIYVRGSIGGNVTTNNGSIYRK